MLSTKNTGKKFWISLGCLTVFITSCSNSKKISQTKETVQATYQAAPDSLHARGISVVGDEIYTANNNGLVYKYDISENSYKQLTQLELPELRDIYVLSEDYFVTMQSAEQSVLLKSKGLVEELVNPFPHKTFLDGMDVNTQGFGILMGDPLEGMLYVAFTQDYGKTWQQSEDNALKAFEGEAGFAASGTNVQVIGESKAVFVSGGKRSRFFKTEDAGKSWFIQDLDFKSSEASGPFSVHFWDEKNGIVVGGNYLEPNDTSQNCFLTRDGGKSWQKPLKTTSGYKSGVISCDGKLYACGTNGIDVSEDWGQSWTKLNDLSSFALACSENKLYATLLKGKVLEIKTK